MTVKHATSLQEYLTILFKDSKEASLLKKELLIGVTRFFRDPEAFAMLANDVITDIVKNSIPKQAIRVWVAACSSGEEAYSIAILFIEEIKKQKLDREIKIFATDVNQNAIDTASLGLYSSEIKNDMNEKYLNAYFVENEIGQFQIAQSIRHSVVFATHNIINDPPFSGVDLVTCRNALIYFQHSAQKRVLSSLQFALKKDAYLFLGSSENLGEFLSHFKTVDERCKISWAW